MCYIYVSIFVFWNRLTAHDFGSIGNTLVCGIIINQLYNQLIIIYLVKLVVVKSFHFHYSIIGFVKYPMMTGSWHLYDAT